MDNVSIQKAPTNFSKNTTNKKKEQAPELFASLLVNQESQSTNQQSTKLSQQATVATRKEQATNDLSTSHISSVNQDEQANPLLQNKVFVETAGQPVALESTNLVGTEAITNQGKQPQLTQANNLVVAITDSLSAGTSGTSQSISTGETLSSQVEPQTNSKVKEPQSLQPASSTLSNAEILPSHSMLNSATSHTQEGTKQSGSEIRELANQTATSSMLEGTPQALKQNTAQSVITSAKSIDNEPTNHGEVLARQAMDPATMTVPVMVTQHVINTAGMNQFQQVQQVHIEPVQEQQLVQTLANNLPKNNPSHVKELTIQLNPSSMGEVTIQMKVTNNQVDLVFKLQTAQTKELFETVAKQFIQTLDTMGQRGEAAKLTVMPQFSIKNNEGLPNLMPNQLQSMQQMSADFSHQHQSQQKFNQESQTVTRSKLFAANLEKNVEDLHTTDTILTSNISILV